MVEFWAGALSISILLYVLLDGFDLGIGLLFPFAAGESGRRQMLAAISPVWDGNETWLVIAGAILFGAFPIVYATLLSAFYLPLFLMLGGLILRGVAFEFRYKTVRFRWVWDAGFVVGSYLATFVQGTTVGALVRGLPIVNGVYVGGSFGWASPFAFLCGLGLCVGYALIGACWIVAKCAGDVRMFAQRSLPSLMVALVSFLIAAFVYALVIELPVLHRWIERPVLLAFPVIGAAAFGMLAVALRRGHDGLPFICGATIFAAAFATLAVSFLPYIVPFSITIREAAAPDASLRFLFWGAGLFVLPITLIYTGVVYFLFRGKARGGEYS
ncbi:cytochrome d ubiquinol oxidase subunit II [Bradyrhizobium genosp. A]|uniref:cytochrome d ubiquinol oxidase subunit II n=1 Tax=Bradyrhizobium genosp. A TaxID=83626 RepID=UPI003CEBEBC4